MPQEIERKFLVDGDWRPLVASSSRIAQGYICSDSGRTVRVRLRDGRGYLTIKGPSADGGLSRYEWEKEIDPADASELMRLCRGGVIDKTRHLVPYDGHVFEVDEFHEGRVDKLTRRQATRAYSPLRLSATVSIRFQSLVNSSTC